MSPSHHGAALLVVVAFLTSIVIAPTLAAPQADPPIAPALAQAETPVQPLPAAATALAFLSLAGDYGGLPISYLVR